MHISMKTLFIFFADFIWKLSYLIIFSYIQNHCIPCPHTYNNCSSMGSKEVLLFFRVIQNRKWLTWCLISRDMTAWEISILSKNVRQRVTKKCTFRGDLKFKMSALAFDCMASPRILIPRQQTFQECCWSNTELPDIWFADWEIINFFHRTTTCQAEA